MRIALFHATLPEPGRKLGGVEVAVHRLANALVSLGRDDVTVLSLSEQPPDAQYAHITLLGGYRRVMQTRAGRLLVLPMLLNFRRWKQFDVVHLHGDDWFFVARPIPTVRTLHGSALREAQNATSRKRKLLQYLVYPLEHVAARLSDRPLAIGADAASLYRTSETVDNGVDDSVFHPGPKSTEPTVIYVGTWEGRKRGRFLFDAFVRHVLPQVPNARLVMVSDHAPEHDRVTAVSYPSDAKLAALLRESWVFALPSAYEGFGIPYLEAMASGTPVVASPNPGSRQVLGEGAFGVLVEDHEFGDAVVQLLRSPERRAELAALGLQRAAHYSWSAIAERHRQIYADVAGIS